MDKFYVLCHGLWNILMFNVTHILITTYLLCKSGLTNKVYCIHYSYTVNTYQIIGLDFVSVIIYFFHLIFTGRECSNGNNQITTRVGESRFTRNPVIVALGWHHNVFYNLFEIAFFSLFYDLRVWPTHHDTIIYYNIPYVCVYVHKWGLKIVQLSFVNDKSLLFCFFPSLVSLIIINGVAVSEGQRGSRTRFLSH